MPFIPDIKITHVKSWSEGGKERQSGKQIQIPFVLRRGRDLAGRGSEISGVRLFGSAGQTISSPDAQDRGPDHCLPFHHVSEIAGVNFKQFKVNKGAQSQRCKSLHTVLQRGGTTMGLSGYQGTDNVTTEFRAQQD